MFLIYDTETTGLPKDYNAPITDADNWPRLVQLAWQLHAADGSLIEADNFIVKPDGFDIPYNSEKVHGISTKKALEEGIPLQEALDRFTEVLGKTKVVAGHNIEFDINIMGAEYMRMGDSEPLTSIPAIDTKNESTEFCAIPGGRGGQFKWPKLTELHVKLFGEAFDEAHNAAADVAATSRCFLELVRLQIIPTSKTGLTTDEFKVFQDVNPNPFKTEDIDVGNQVAASKKAAIKKIETAAPKVEITHDFAHLHCHSQFSVLQATIRIKNLVTRAVEYGMPAVALTDHANMFGTFHFVNEIEAANASVADHNAKIEAGEAQGQLKKPIKGIVGCEFYVTDDHKDRTRQNNGYQTVLLAKNKKGYHNLVKLSSISYAEGFYYVPRIDKELLLKYKDNLIVSTGGPGGEVPNLILNVGEKQAEEAFIWYKEQFGEDFYVELVDHGLEGEKRVNQVLLEFAKKHGVSYFPSNNVYYLSQKDKRAHDILMCLKEGVKMEDDSRGREFIKRLFPNDQYYFKGQQEMKQIFAHLPEAFETITEIVEKIEPFRLKQDVLLPVFDIPSEFLDPADKEDGGKRGENAYLRHLTYEGAVKRYGEVTDEIRDRIDFELQTIANSGYPGYFLIVQDFTSEARKMGVAVGPGRGSAAGSVVAYCVGITNVDPIAYDLLFERFLNPDRVSLPDIDIDFDDEGRGKIIDWVVAKYGKNQVAQIVTYGSMAAKSAIRDTARVLNLPLSDADHIAKLIPDISLAKIFDLSEKELKSKLGDSEKVEQAMQLRKYAEGNDEIARTINEARVLEGSIRNTGIHACGVIITPDDITNHIPVTTAKDSELSVTQFDNSVVESSGMLKMDFLGLKTLTIIKDAIKLIKARHGIDIDPDEIPLDDEKTYKLYQRGQTNGTFQFESAGMQKHLRSLKPDKFADLIAMNALYRPGPLKYIPNFIARKNGEEEITYDLPEMEEYLAETYGISVYQEQVMRLSQKLAGFSKGDADVLRKAMGKKIFALLAKLKPQFLAGCEKNGHDLKIAEKIWSDWEEFAEYAFNKSHSTCYSVVAFQTGYLKANYPAEYMASVMTHNMNDIKKVTFFMDECRRMGMAVLGPDVNESQFKFAVNDKGEIRFGLGAIKGVGEGAVEAIIAERTSNGNFSSIFDLTKRIDLRAANKKALESLAISGAFDSFENSHRAQYFFDDGSGPFLEKAIKYGSSFQSAENSSQVSLFGEASDVQLPEPQVPKCEKWGNIQELKAEKEVVGVYISGHPLDDFELVMQRYCNINLGILESEEAKKNPNEYKFAGVVSAVQHRMSKQNNPYGIFEIEDKQGSMEFRLFGEDYTKFRQYLDMEFFLFVRGVWKEKRWGSAEGVPAEKEFKLNSIELLNDMLEKKTTSITITMPLEEVKPENISELQSFLEGHPGSCKVNMRVINKQGVWVDMHSKKVRVKPEQKLIYDIREQLGLEVSFK
ncbi:MAG: DNA polymerase III subunit alpha [Flavobacteriales bacterium]|nr:DNA polymerase III subunit alpha [Flavobacteriales bacterium]